ncbi:calcitonin gene-related peptide type 1 receptor-like isoform X1 [Centruroides sculpturatus]|uniref:calcitonin gene-related peptide type 1 receptor-like isoform X1 n=1 Tax=Centruroides sculpturatus TaxID=218467 RepID=UPI000C6CC84D|nr:calcitonin gene-related peptide type 1 receptor-like isoform X1 [Centruroides sculpturatus]
MKALMIMLMLITCSDKLSSYNISQDDYFAQETKPIYCRSERGVSLSFDIYKKDTCARCYNYLPSWAFVDTGLRFRYNFFLGTLVDPKTNISYTIDPNNLTHPIFDTFVNNVFASKWTSCCHAAVACCEKMASDPKPDQEKLYCPRTWDGWQCWSDTPAGQVAQSVCQEHIYFSSKPPPCPRYAVKACTSEGSWYVRGNFSEWTNYNGCGRVEGMLRLQYFHIATHSVSMSFLVPAIITFVSYKQLRVYRIIMHRNLFISLFLNGVFVILFKSIVMLDELHNFDNTILDENKVGCKILLILTKYFQMTNYMWMFCEGFYLHRLIAAAFAEQKNIIKFYFIGWGFPIIPITIYAILRENFANSQCWAIPADPYEWILNIPNLFSLMLNFVFLCHIIQVLVTKLQATHANEPSQYSYFRKAVRATLVLAPLFGLHFSLAIYRPHSVSCELLEAYTFFTYTLDGLQGFLVSLIFCYFNSEVMYLFKRSYKRHQLRHITPRKPLGRLGLSRLSLSTQMSSVLDNHITTNRRTSRQIGGAHNTTTC